MRNGLGDVLEVHGLPLDEDADGDDGIKCRGGDLGFTFSWIDGRGKISRGHARKQISGRDYPGSGRLDVGCSPHLLHGVWEFIASWDILDDDIVLLYPGLKQRLPGPLDQGVDDESVPTGMNDCDPEIRSWKRELASTGTECEFGNDRLVEAPLRSLLLVPF